MKTILKTAREQKNIKTRELAQLLGIDQAQENLREIKL